ncbi:MAG: hypothetical protein RLZZ594_761, partial [Actinomycetota bacterium]
RTMTSSSGLYTGATYADVNATIPGFQILAMISAVVAALFLVSAVIGKWRLAIMGTALMVISSIVLGGVYPWVVQNFQVGPNERTLEAEYIDRNIEATRKASSSSSSTSSTTTSSRTWMLTAMRSTARFKTPSSPFVSSTSRVLAIRSLGTTAPSSTPTVTVS